MDKKPEGLEPLLGERPTVLDRAGTVHTMPPLNLEAVFRLVRLLREFSLSGQRAALEAFGDAALGHEERLGAVLLLGLSEPSTEESITEYLAFLAGVSPDEFCNPELWGLSEQFEVVAKLAEHPDLTAFFTKVQGAAKSGNLNNLLKLFGNKQ
ncbi:hypothetical protein Mgrana_00073 [Meiothermus granaticius NBRC 107808]|uniref:Uncharacterized protein n=2 Tax=Meiothermus TaxID=65551 RepID=A0A399FBL0_9DEIN|nr:hypothetical protein Mgrana_00073 [Meiothermus granaticius NBRC 107808]